jgi:putative oxidoreductase
MLRRLAPVTASPAVDAATLVMRVIVGPIMAYHGWKKVQGGVGNFAKFVATNVDLPAPELVARAVVVIELAGGIFLMLGLLTRLWALLVAGQMISIVFLLKWDAGLIGPPGQGGGYELDLVIAASALGLLLIGPGRLSLDHLLSRERVPSGRSEATAGSAAPT